MAIVGKISAQPHPTLCIQFLNRENNDKNNTFPLEKQIWFTLVWGYAETLPIVLLKTLVSGFFTQLVLKIVEISSWLSEKLSFNNVLNF